MKQIEVIDTVIKYLTRKGWKEIFSNRPGNNHAAHGFVVPLKGKIVDSVLFKNGQLMILEADSKISLKDHYHTKLLELKDYLTKNSNLSNWIKEIERRNQIKIGEVKQLILALAYYETDFRMNLVKPDLVAKGFNLYRTLKEGKVVEEHKTIHLRINDFLHEKFNKVHRKRRDSP
ncbi:MAG: hypothetical protein QW228_05010 [Candidatus Aenigmatarchaeota archaeon]